MGPGTRLWDTAGEYRNLLVAGSALVLQTMHPAVGAAVAQRSDFRTDPWGRLSRTLGSVQRWVYADGEAEVRRLRDLHAGIKGVDEYGRPYHALQAEAWAWVHWSLFEQFRTLERIFGAGPVDERAMFDDFQALGRLLRVRSPFDDLAGYAAYFDRMVAERLEAHPTAIEVLATLRATPSPPYVPGLVWKPVGVPASELNYFITVGTLPPAVREKLGLRWSARRERLLRAIGRAAAAVAPRLPERVRYMPLAYRARRAARG
ncbi:oxygenase MpaB family protein [Nonomuraea sp. NPDC050310]|uniref:oxygenase MpaB family protein n=1 Tax=unclassified Nonomuraea TaxID=2593643 RepID=UPI0033C7B210